MSARSVADANGLSDVEVIRRAFVAGTPGAPDDVTIYSAAAQSGFRILDAQVVISTLIAAATVQLRSATGGGGVALSDAFVASVVGRKLDAGVGIGNVTPTVAAGGTLVLRRSDAGVAGEVIVWIRRE